MPNTNVTADMAAIGAVALPGESFWCTEGGNVFKVLIIHDEVVSQHGNECFRFQACQVDASGAPVPRSDGREAWDPHGYVHQIAAGAETAVDAALQRAVETYLKLLDSAVVNHVQTNAAITSGLVVPSSKAHRIPEHLNHLRRN